MFKWYLNRKEELRKEREELEQEHIKAVTARARLKVQELMNGIAIRGARWNASEITVAHDPFRIVKMDLDIEGDGVCVSAQSRSALGTDLVPLFVNALLIAQQWEFLNDAAANERAAKLREHAHSFDVHVNITFNKEQQHASEETNPDT